MFLVAGVESARAALQTTRRCTTHTTRCAQGLHYALRCYYYYYHTGDVGAHMGTTHYYIPHTTYHIRSWCWYWYCWYYWHWYWYCYCCRPAAAARCIY
jgi:hypothetical protein